MALRDKDRALERAANSTSMAATAYVQKRDAEMKFVFAAKAATEAKQSAQAFAAKCAPAQSHLMSCQTYSLPYPM